MAYRYDIYLTVAGRVMVMAPGGCHKSVSRTLGVPSRLCLRSCCRVRVRVAFQPSAVAICGAAGMLSGAAVVLTVQR
ncbi:hypothetical protein JIQ42_04518 [Leishmania sp. Namibia]|uniref:hypothetical protein n=1 Tax=Leishmania sp. Namibia TaxID=2802991 RepID=UPI001B785DFE|nr:hypothetical protein JIQ42_04518 [Leishmania sp. Namibia]